MKRDAVSGENMSRKTGELAKETGVSEAAMRQRRGETMDETNPPIEAYQEHGSNDGQGRTLRSALQLIIDLLDLLDSGCFCRGEYLKQGVP